MNPYLGEIRIFSGSFAPKGWALCNGQLLNISQNAALFSVLGTSFGGNGSSTFALPNMQSSAPVHVGQGSGLSNYSLGQAGGAEAVTLTSAQMPAHNHSVATNNGPGTSTHPAGNFLASSSSDRPYGAASDGSILAPTAVSINGSGQPHTNVQPYLAMTFIIALQGIFPPRN